MEWYGYMDYIQYHKIMIEIKTLSCHYHSKKATCLRQCQSPDLACSSASNCSTRCKSMATCKSKPYLLQQTFPSSVPRLPVTSSDFHIFHPSFGFHACEWSNLIRRHIKVTRSGRNDVLYNCMTTQRLTTTVLRPGRACFRLSSASSWCGSCCSGIALVGSLSLPGGRAVVV